MAQPLSRVPKIVGGRNLLSRYHLKMRLELDRGILLTVFFLLGLGLVQVYSSSYIFASESYGDGLFFFRKQMLFTILAVVAMLLVAVLPWAWSKLLGQAFWVVAAVGVALTFIPGLAIKVSGAHRWIALPWGQRFEPAELLRVTYPLMLAGWIQHYKERDLDFQWWMKTALLVAPLLLVQEQPDFGSFIICSSLIFVVLFAHGLSWRVIAAGAVVTLPILFYLVIGAPYRYARIQTFLDPWADPAEKGFQIIQSLLSFYNGGLWGSGLGQGQGKLFFLPEAHTDFTLAVLGEEMGFLGFAFVVMMYGFIVFRGFQIALRTQPTDQRVSALGLAYVFAISVIINAGVNLGLLPTKGLTLPFLSYGGSSLVCTALAMGWLLNVERGERKGYALKKQRPLGPQRVM